MAQSPVLRDPQEPATPKYPHSLNKAQNYQGISNRVRERTRSTIARRLPAIVTNLCECAEGVIDMTPQQLRAAMGLLNKVLPDAIAEDAATGQTLAQILADIAKALPFGAHVGIAVTAGDGTNTPIVTPGVQTDNASHGLSLGAPIDDAITTTATHHIDAPQSDNVFVDVDSK